jgi:hypothetical protein
VIIGGDAAFQSRLTKRQIMRNGQNKRMRGRNRKSQNPLTRVYESNGPDVKIRGTASHIAEKYVQLARDAQGSGDPVAAENYYQHAEHYFRLIAAAQEQFRQSQPFYRQDERPSDDSFDDDDEDSAHPMMGGGEPGYTPREPQPYTPREMQQPYPRREPQPYGGHEQQPPRPQHTVAPDSEAPGLPSFITGSPQPQPHQNYGSNGHGHEGGADRFPLHRRRRRHRGPRSDMPSQSSGGDTPDDSDGGRPQGE